MNHNNLYSLSRVKVNLYLHLINQRKDGNHNLDSLVAFPEIGDEIIISPSSIINLQIEGKLRNELNIEDNLILRAAKLFKNSNKGADIILKKTTPISAGLGGGSSNAAVTLKLLSKLWDVPLPPLNKLVSLGADIPVCMSWHLQRMQGIGEKTQLLNPPKLLWIVLLNNGEKVSTKLIFSKISHSDFSGLIKIPKFKDKNEFIQFIKSTKNDLESTTIKIFPAIKNLLDILKSTNGCVLSRMTGSGSTCFGLYTKKIEADEAKNQALKNFPKAWVRVAKLFS